jgi:hypothetical protein
VRKAIVASTPGAGPVQPGGGKLVVINAENGLERDSAAWLKCTPDALKQKLADLVTALENPASASAEMKALTAHLTGRPTTLLAGTALACDPEAQVLLEKLAVLLGADGTGGLVGAPTMFANGRGAMDVLGDSALVDATAKDGVLGRVWSGAIETLVMVGDVQVNEAGNARSLWFTGSLGKDAATDGSVPGHVDVVIPLAHTYEQAGSFTNLEGRVQGFDAAGIPPGEAKSDWAALVALSTELGMHLPHDLKGLRAHLGKDFAFFTRIPSNRTKGRAELHIV